MSADYEIREVTVELESAVSVHAQVSSLSGIRALLADLKGAGLGIAAKPSDQKPGNEGGPAKSETGDDDPVARMETKASLGAGSLAKAKIVAFKDDVPQLLRPNMFPNVTDALLVLLFAVEAGLQQAKLQYEAFKGLYEAQNIKSGSPMRLLLSNLRASNYLDKNVYSADKSITLTAKGETRAIEVLRTHCN